MPIPEIEVAILHSGNNLLISVNITYIFQIIHGKYRLAMMEQITNGKIF